MTTTTEPTSSMDDAHLEEQLLWAVSDLLAEVRRLVGDLQERSRSVAGSSSALEGSSSTFPALVER